MYERYAPSVLVASSEIVKFISRFEGFHSKAYLCPAGVWTIGFGHTSGVRKGDVVTEDEALKFLRSDLRTAEGTIRLAVKAPLRQCEFDALTSFIFNVGGGNFAKSTMRQLINEHQYDLAAREFRRWNKAGGFTLAGLVRRRKAEEKVWRDAIYSV